WSRCSCPFSSRIIDIAVFVSTHIAQVSSIIGVYVPCPAEPLTELLINFPRFYEIWVNPAPFIPCVAGFWDLYLHFFFFFCLRILCLFFRFILWVILNFRLCQLWIIEHFFQFPHGGAHIYLVHLHI